MLQPITGLSDGVIGFAAIGVVTAADHHDALLPAIDEALLNHKRIRLLYEVGPDFGGFDVSALWEDIQMSVAQFQSFERIAFVTDFDWLRAAAGAFTFMIPAQVRVYGLADGERAREWLNAS